MVDHGHAQLLLGPPERLRIAALAREEECAETRQVVATDVLAFRILLADGAKGGRGGEERAHPVVGDHAPERARIGCADRLSLVEHGGAAVEERRIDDVGVADDPADVRRGPVHLSRRDVVDVLHRPLERYGVAAVVSHDPLRLACRPRGVEDVEGIRGLDGYAGRRLCDSEGLLPFDVTTGTQLGLVHRPLHEDAALGLRLDHRDRGVQERLVGDDAPTLEPARSGDDDLRLGVFDAACELVRCEAAEDNRMDRPDPRTRQHRDDRFRDHRHVDDHPVSALDSMREQDTREPRDKVAQLTVRERSRRPGDRRVVDQCRLVGSAALDVPVEGVVTRVQARAAEPAIERRLRVVEHPRPGLDPVDRPGCLGPEVLWLLERAQIHLVKPGHLGPPAHDRTPLLG